MHAGTPQPLQQDVPVSDVQPSLGLPRYPQASRLGLLLQQPFRSAGEGLLHAYLACSCCGDGLRTGLDRMLLKVSKEVEREPTALH